MKKQDVKSNYTVERYDDRDTWLKHRGIGGSSAAAILHKSKWMTTQDIYNFLVLGEEKSIPDNDRMQEGTLSEAPVRRIFSLIYRNKYKVINPPKRGSWQFRRIDEPLLTLTPDGLLVDKETKQLGAIEIKNVQLIKREAKNMWENDMLPDQYYCQVLHYFVVKKDVQFVILYALLQYFNHDDISDKWIPDHQLLKSYYVDRKEIQKEIDYLEIKEIEFINNYIKKKKRPPLQISF